MKLLRYIILITFTLLLTSVGNKALATSTNFFQQVPKKITKPADTSKRDTSKVKMKKGVSGLDDKIEHFANDSTHVDKKNGIVHFYGKARVIYDTFELDAEYIRYDSKNNIIFARGVTNDKGKYYGRPIFKMGADGSGIADSISYNTKTGKGNVDGIFKEQEGGFFTGGRTKVQPDNEFHVSNTTYSTCNLPEPHFGLHITKGIATENHIITGPVYFEFERIPMPLGLPFAFFPKPNKKSSGFILPTPGEDATKGFSLTNGGYYVILSDYWDAKVTGNIFTNGSYDLNLATNYLKRYKYGGNLNLAYSSTRNGLEGTPEYKPQKNFHIGWTHSQNANARPGTTFSASVNAGTSSYFSTTAANATYDINQIAQNTLSSSIAYGKVFGDGLFNLTAALSHSQETQAKTISLTLPQVSLNMSTLTAGEYTLSTGMSTKLYFRKRFSNMGKIKGFSHVMTPNFSFSYKPDFSSSNFGYYKDQKIYNNDLRPNKRDWTGRYLEDYQGKRLKYSIFEQGIYGGPSAGKQASIGFSLDNNVELKVASASDTTGTGEKKIPIIQGLTFSSSYNFVADSMKLAPISFGGRSQFTDKLGFNFSGSLSPYAVKNVGTVANAGTANQTILPSYREVDSYRLPRLTTITFSTDFSFNPEALKSRNKNVDAVKNQAPTAGRTQEETDRLQAISRDPNAFVDFNIPWNIALSYSFNYSNPLGRKETRTISNTLNFNGDFNLTPKWKIQFNSGYDFKAKNISYTSFAIYRDLHCWDLSASWIPFGAYQSYSIDIKVKASVLQDLKLSKRKGYYTKY
ncbi:MAG: LPS-assembly protein LptD [Pedobacter sp.]|nr:MAG: LPS-assembly protein LptD [Pedobacter sp.]